jgi:hypothetical protein
MRIYKYWLPIADMYAIMMPIGAEVLSVQAQDGLLCVWAKVDPNAARVGTVFRIYGTGHPLDDTVDTVQEYLGTVQIDSMVWHVYKVN